MAFRVIYVLAISLGLSGCDYARTALCLKSHTRNTCMAKALLCDASSTDLEEGASLTGQSKSYSLTVPNSQWVKMWPDQRRKEDLVLIHQSGRALIQGDWLVSNNQTSLEYRFFEATMTRVR